MNYYWERYSAYNDDNNGVDTRTLVKQFHEYVVSVWEWGVLTQQDNDNEGMDQSTSGFSI